MVFSKKKVIRVALVEFGINKLNDLENQSSMITWDSMNNEQILNIRLKGPLESYDFEKLAHAVDPLMVQKETVQGILVQAQEFSGWENFGALTHQLHFEKTIIIRLKKWLS